MVRDVRKDEAASYFNKAENFYAASLDEFEKSRFDVAVFNASQSIILANDSLCIAALGRRPSKDHREAIQLHIQAAAGRESKRDIISEALTKRGEFGYTEKNASKEEAHMLLVRTKRFLDWVKERI
ncbi:MAG: HEPN domain-containing protein [Nanoarchaeota archaeon]|nr:HEPN domain-containing protein [Nanoarchaeota archaeon]MBU4452392.1 HEPN domain-containing protein [Nanoarchaeota archaeon]MCG2723332.1 HEPN domain-containing protein [archaeon]